MRRKSVFIVVAGVSLVLSLVLQAPAATVFAWLMPDDSRVELLGLDGTVRRGQAAMLEFDGRPLFEQLRWRWRLSDLLLGRLGAVVESNGQLLLSAHVSQSLTTRYAGGLRLNGPLTPLLAAAAMPLPVDGQLGLNLKRLKLRDNWPTAIDGTAQIDRLAYSLGRTPLVLGSYAAELGNDGDDLVATIHTLAGVLDVAGDLRAKPDRSYALHLQLRPKAGAPAMVDNLLKTLGAPDPQGYYHLRREGSVAE